MHAGRHLHSMPCIQLSIVCTGNQGKATTAWYCDWQKLAMGMNRRLQDRRCKQDMAPTCFSAFLNVCHKAKGMWAR